jgi:sarcosine oxidase subunit alpha
MSRLAQGGLIDRSRRLAFSFDGRAMSGYAGDTLASALVANDVKLVGRSFKYHRPRGILTAGSEEPNALVTLRAGARAEPNTKATTVELYDGLVAASQNRWPSLSFDLMAVNQLAGPMFAAGFYYKTFMWPKTFWEKVYEPLIRRAAGLGALSGLPDPDAYDREPGFCDLLVIGGGPAGLVAALTAGRAGLRVILAEEDFELGGRLLSDAQRIDGAPAVLWVQAAAAELAALPNVRVLTRTTVFGVYDGEYGAIERVSDHLPEPPPGQPRQRLWKIVAKRAVLAAGAIERPIVFGGNDRPGVMTASAISTWLNRHAAAPGKRAVVFTGCDTGWACAEHLLDAGVEVAAVVASRGRGPDAAERIAARGVPIHLNAVVTDARGAPVEAVDIRTQDGRRVRIAADLLAVSGGWTPSIGLGAHLGAAPVWSDYLQAFRLGETPPGLAAAGAADGRYGLAAALADGQKRALEAMEALGRTAPASPLPAAEDEPAGSTPIWFVKGCGTKAFVDFQNDVTDKDVALAAREGFASVEHLKRYTTLGMATDQGKTSQLNGHALLAEVTHRSIAEVGVVRARPPAVPVAIGALAGHHRGRNFRPARHTAGHAWASAQGARFADSGPWKRAQCFARPGLVELIDLVNAEVEAVRTHVGVCDVSTLGKIELFGPDAGALLDRLYINTLSTLPIGRARYGVMLREDGFVLDDGTVSRLDDEHFFVTTTTANAARVMQHLDFHRQVVWPELDVAAVSSTEQWATYAVAGPRSRALLQRLLPGLDLSNAAFPYMAAGEIAWGEFPARLFRLSFSGELAYEIAVPAYAGEDLVKALFAAGAALGVAPYGVEALGVLRIEKGHPAGGELNGRTTAADLGLGRMMSKKKDFVGRVMAERPGLTDPARPRLVGLRPLDPHQRLRAGAHLLRPGEAPVAANDEGCITSAAYSPTLGHPIALALLARGAERHGERIVAHDPVRGGDVEAEVCSPVFVDPEGARLNG